MVSLVHSLPLSKVEIPEPRGQAASGERCGSTRTQTNVGAAERVLSIFGGSMLVAGGIKRLSLPGLVMAGIGGALIHRGSTGQCGVYKLLGVTAVPEQRAARQLTSNPLNQTIRVERSVAIHKPVGEVYAFWRNLENLPRFMNHLESVTVVDPHRSIWRAKAPRGRTVQWNADIVEEEINKKIAWKSVQGADVPNAGQVLFEAIPGGTTVTVLLAYTPPAGVLGALVARLFGEEPHQTVKEDLRRLKQILETGETPTTEGQPQGDCTGKCSR
jgi:uncharacterized membrane protein